MELLKPSGLVSLYLSLHLFLSLHFILLNSFKPFMLYGTLNLSGFIINEIDARNAYPYTKTVFSCPFVEKFNLEIETFYLPG